MEDRRQHMDEPRERKKQEQEQSLATRMKRKGLAFLVSVRERLQYIKATIFGQMRKIKARNEKEAAEADLQSSKMQVEAANEAESNKQRLGEEGF